MPTDMDMPSASVAFSMMFGDREQEEVSSWRCRGFDVNVEVSGGQLCTWSPRVGLVKAVALGRRRDYIRPSRYRYV